VSCILKSKEKQTLTREDMKKMIKLESCIYETIRLTAGVTLIRQCIEDTDITLDSGNSYKIRKGDRILYPTGFEWLYDTDYFGDDLDKFKWDRFLVKDKYCLKSSSDFVKNGKRSVIAWAPFGAGESLCPGRHFAVNEIKVFVAHVIQNLDLELNVNCEAKLDRSKFGSGVLCPAFDQTFPTTIQVKSHM